MGVTNDEVFTDDLQTVLCLSFFNLVINIGNKLIIALLFVTYRPPSLQLEMSIINK